MQQLVKLKQFITLEWMRALQVSGIFTYQLLIPIQMHEIRQQKEKSRIQTSLICGKCRNDANDVPNARK